VNSLFIYYVVGWFLQTELELHYFHLEIPQSVINAIESLGSGLGSVHRSTRPKAFGARPKASKSRAPTHVSFQLQKPIIQNFVTQKTTKREKRKSKELSRTHKQ
jgi:hypothetical protein